MLSRLFQRLSFAVVIVAIFLFLAPAAYAASSGSETLGASTLGPYGDSSNDGLLLAQKATLATTGTLQTLSFYVSSGAAGSMHLAVYSDNSGQPGKLLAKTADFAVVDGWNTQPVATQVALQPGTYWLAYEYTASSVQFLRFGSGTFRGIDRAWGALPATWGTSTLSGSDQWSLYAMLGLGSTTPPSSLISNLVVNDKANAADWSIQSNLQIGNHLYGDRSYAVASLPAGFAGSSWIRPANDSKLYRGTPLVSFKVTADSTVYVVHSDSAPKPSWLSSWTNTGSKLVSNEPDTYSVYSKSYTTGATVSLGPNADVSDSHNTYVIVVKPATTSSQSETLGDKTLGTIGDSDNVGLLLAQKATLATAGNLQTLSFYVTSGAAGSMHLAVYSDNSGQPGKLLAKTADFAVVNGWNTQPVATQVALQPGTYWLAYEYTASSVQFLRFGNGTFSGMNRAWGALPATWGTSTLSGADHWSFYATLGVNSTPPPSQSETLGDKTLGTIGDSDNVGLLLAQKATLGTSGTLQTLSFYVSSGAAGSMHLAVYGDNGGEPGNLLAKTADFAVVNGWNTQPVTTQVALQPGTYWLAYEYTASSVQFLRFGSGTFSGINRAWGALPATWGTSTLSGADHWSFYATLGVSGTTPPPPPPPSSSSATLSWAASTSSTVTGYRIYYGTSSGVYTNHVDVGDVTTYTIQDLSPGTYYFVVTAYDAAGNESGYSNEVSKTIQ